MAELVTALEQAHRESPSWRLYGLCHQAATRIAELEAENERLMNECDEWTNRCRAAVVAFDEQKARAEFVEAEALSRTGAVKVRELLCDFEDFINQPPQYEDLRIVREYRHELYRKWEPLCRLILSALEPAAPPSDIPEGQQPVAYEAGIVALLLDASMKPEEISVGSVRRPARVRELVHWFARLAKGEANPKWTRYHASELAYFVATSTTRPAEQAVTEAMVEAAANQLGFGSADSVRIRAALKAAMEAGRHE